LSCRRVFTYGESDSREGGRVRRSCLAGEVRPAPQGQERLKEAAKIGFEKAIVPRANQPKGKISGLEVFAVDRVDQAVQSLRNL